MWLMTRYYLASAVAIAIQYATAMLIVALWSKEGTGTTDLFVGQLVGIGLGTIVNYFINNVWTFRGDAPSAGASGH